MLLDQQIDQTLYGCERCVKCVAQPYGAQSDIVANQLRRVERLDDDAQELMPGLGHTLEIVALLDGQGGVVLLEQELAIAEDRIHRRAQLVTDVADERFDRGHGLSRSATARRRSWRAVWPDRPASCRSPGNLRRARGAIGFHRMRRQRDDGNRRSRRLGAYEARDLAAIHVRQADIHQDQVRLLGGRGGGAGRAVECHDDIEAALGQAPAQHVAIHLVVFDQKDFRHGSTSAGDTLVARARARRAAAAPAIRRVRQRPGAAAASGASRSCAAPATRRRNTSASSARRNRRSARPPSLLRRRRPCLRSIRTPPTDSSPWKARLVWPSTCAGRAWPRTRPRPEP